MKGGYSKFLIIFAIVILMCSSFVSAGFFDWLLGSGMDSVTGMAVNEVCEEDSDCASCMNCRSGRCVAKTTCDGNSDCPSSCSQCRDNGCRQFCDGPGQCGKYACKGGACITYCTSSEQCYMAGDFECNTYECRCVTNFDVNDQQFCDGPGQCGKYACKGGRCKACCVRDEECYTNGDFVCDESSLTCIKKGDTEVGSDCNEAEDCVSGYCLNGQCACNDDNECNEDYESCNSAGGCEVATCSSDDECRGNAICNELIGYCKLSGDKQVGESCSIDNDCISGSCTFATCICNGDNDCPAGKTCNDQFQCEVGEEPEEDGGEQGEAPTDDDEQDTVEPEAPECESHNNCDEGQRCDDGACISLTDIEIQVYEIHAMINYLQEKAGIGTGNKESGEACKSDAECKSGSCSGWLIWKKCD